MVPATFGSRWNNRALKRYSVDALERACRERGFQVFGYGRLKRILERQEKAPQTLRTPSLKVGERPNELAMAAVGVEQRDLSYYGGGGQ